VLADEQALTLQDEKSEEERYITLGLDALAGS
jgi:hypothetical protein